jgi:hypothetical protein
MLEFANSLALFLMMFILDFINDLLPWFKLLCYLFTYNFLLHV